MKNATGWTTEHSPRHGITTVTTPFDITYTGHAEPILPPTPATTTGPHPAPDPDPPPF
ncbi:hypothetical protein [Saccharomonospora sp. CUA-673]|uniref:hypothetical protein n=1 Tax=Saccharomonospora sp. CUA-673 TaxID=1904969 RepID=UPI0013011732|nr:hypothetical protein [Saccharomonospora sp. CUA-673]